MEVVRLGVEEVRPSILNISNPLPYRCTSLLTTAVRYCHCQHISLFTETRHSLPTKKGSSCSMHVLEACMAFRSITIRVHAESHSNSARWVVPLFMSFAYRRLRSHHFSEYKTPRHAWSSSWVQGSTSLHVFSNCIGCLSAGASSSNCAALCIQFSTESARCIYQTSFRQWVPSSPTTILIDRLRATTTSHQVRRARLFSRWSVCMEQTARRHSRGTWHNQLSKTS